MAQIPEFWYLFFDNELAEKWIAEAASPEPVQPEEGTQ